jgi:alpha,alpha-trehalose phosphorylase
MNPIIRNGRLEVNEIYVDEAIFALANGFLGTRGHFTEGYGHDFEYNGTFMNGFYNTYAYRYEENSLQFPQVGQVMVNLPDASLMTIMTDSEAINLTDATLIDLKRTYDLNQGMTRRKAVYQTPKGFEFTLIEERMVSRWQKDLIITRLTIESTNYAGDITIRSFLKMPRVRLITTNDPRLTQGKTHLLLDHIEAKRDRIVLRASTTHTRQEVEVGITHDASFDYEIANNIGVAIKTFRIEARTPVSITKYQVYQGTHRKESLNVGAVLDKVAPIDFYLMQQKAYLDEFWRLSSIRISDQEIEDALNYNVYQLDSNTAASDLMQVAAKGLTGDGYEGHYFWDTEIYMLPYFILTNPKKARSLLMYRYHKLPEAKLEANKLGASRGAKIPWRTINGMEASPYYPAGSAQVHINSDVSFAVMQYYYATKDERFMVDYGFELILETALFLLDLGHFQDGRFHIDGVTGPDEYTVLVHDNYYTNAMAKRHFERLCSYGRSHIEDISDVLARTGVDSKIFDDFEYAAKHIVLHIDPKRKMVLQDENFCEQEDLNLATIPKENFPLLLYFHPLFIYRHQVLKQADALLALVLLNDIEKEIYENSFDYYLKRTTHDSSLSKGIYGIAAYAIDKSKLGYEFFKETCFLDFHNRKKHTQHGLHVANMGATYLMVLYGLFNVRLEETLAISPRRQESFTYYAITIRYQGVICDLKVEDDILEITTSGPLNVRIDQKDVLVKDVYRKKLIN